MNLFFNDRTLRWHRVDPETKLHPMVPTALAESWWAEQQAAQALTSAWAIVAGAAMTWAVQQAAQRAVAPQVRQAMGAVRWEGVHKVRPEPAEHPAVTSARKWGHKGSRP